MRRRIMIAVMIAAGTMTAGTANAQAARHYDCSKAGNANKAACKAAPTPTPTPTKRAAAVTSTARTYDCSKPGNSNKQACKAKPAAGPTPAATTKPATSERHYDCGKAGNANKAACKGASGSVAGPPSVAPSAAPKPVTASALPKGTPTTAGQDTHPGGPNGATAKCRDTTLSFSKHRSGTCSRHGGVAQWY